MKIYCIANGILTALEKPSEEKGDEDISAETANRKTEKKLIEETAMTPLTTPGTFLFLILYPNGGLCSQ